MDNNLAETLLKLGRKRIYIEKYIKENAKTRAISKLRKQFEDLIKNDNRFFGERTSEIFISLGTKKGEKQFIYYPKVNDSFYSHVCINQTSPTK